MSEQVLTFEGEAINPGLDYAIEIEILDTVFPPEATFTAGIKRRKADTNPLATLTTAAGAILPLGGGVLKFIISGATSASWTDGEVMFDVIRTDTSPDQKLGITVTLVVERLLTPVA